MAVQSVAMFVLTLILLSITDVTRSATTPGNTTDVPTTTNVAVPNNVTTIDTASNNSATSNSTNDVRTITNDVILNNVTTDPTAKNKDDGTSNTMSDERIAIIILASVLGLFFLFLFCAVCAWLTSNSMGKHRNGRYRSRRRRRRYYIGSYPSSEQSSHADEIYVPFDGPPEMTSSHKKSSALEPYYSLPVDTKYSPYLFDDDMGQYMQGDLNQYRGYDFDRPYFSSTGLKEPFDNYPSDWYRSMPVNLDLTLPRPWIS